MRVYDKAQKEQTTGSRPKKTRIITPKTLVDKVTS